MGPSEVQEFHDMDPFIPFRMTLSSGSVIDITGDETLVIWGLSLAVADRDMNGRPRSGSSPSPISLWSNRSEAAGRRNAHELERTQ